VRESLRIVHAQRDLVVDEVPEGSSTISVVDLDAAMDVRDQLAALPPMQRAVLVLRDLEDLSEDELRRVKATFATLAAAPATHNLDHPPPHG